MVNSKAIRYDVIVQDAMLGVVKKVLEDAQNDGLHNDHHFYLTYSTCFEGVEIPSSLLSKYPDEITIVLQHEFENLIVHEDHFLVTLWFNNVPAHLRVPFKAIKAFFDPSVKFGLQFNVLPEEDHADNQVTAEVTSLDAHQNSASIKELSDKKKPTAEANKKASKSSEKTKQKSEDKDKSDLKKAHDKNSDDKSDNIVSLDAFRKK